ncbi:FG-GAP repeat domain-containing protein [Sinosporangium siamense]|uniref:VCBS repeat-containing protein n=1 Tax=Sinosporangium siamense TaxID=1367973 RepID=A0A919REU9_9ACTN|nr:VCBS repeat-containing protein [Sinosporangium siamense]GII92333.1 hypothetical protein Ssi02_25640 [Sinosporangium siamense]
MTPPLRIVTAAAVALAVLATALPAAHAAAGPPGDHHRVTRPGKPVKLKGKKKTWDVSAIRSKERPAAPAAAARSAALPPDVNGDGRADLVAQLSGADAGSLRVHANNGATTSNPWEAAFTATSSQWGFADLVLLADVTGDGRADVIARDPAVSSGTLWLYPHDGSNAANPWPSRIAAGTGWNSLDKVAVADVTGDGKPDLVARNPSVGGGTLYVYPGNGATAANPWTRSPIWSGSGWNLAQTLSVGDVTGDNRPEIVARNGEGAVLVYPHNGATSTNFWTSIVFGSTGGWNTSDRLSMADVTGDGRPDLIARDTSGSLWVHPWQSGTAGAMWSPTARFAAGTGFNYAFDVMTGDVNGDGKLELVTQVARNSELWLFPHDGSATGNPWPARTAAGTDWGSASQVYLGDVNGDRRQDLIALDRRIDGGTLWIYINNGSTTGSPWSTRYFGGNGWNIFNSLLLGDVTGDGRADVVGRSPNGDMFAYPGNGSATAFPWDTRAWVGSNWQTATRLALGDIDRDGIADLVDLENDGSLWVFPTGASTDPIRIPGTWTGTRTLNLGHVTGGTGPDLVVGDASGNVSIYPNTGATSGNPWSSTPRPGGSGYQDAASLVL